MKVCICEDDAQWRTRCQEMVLAVAKAHGIPVELQKFSTGDQLLFEAENIAPSIDLLLLDIAMPGTDGLAVAERISSFGFTGVIVFLTNSDKFYATAFDLHAFNYIEKSASAQRFERVFLEAAREVSSRMEEYISLACAGTRKNIRVSDVLYFDVNKAIVTVHCLEDGEFEFYSTLDKIEERLLGKGFLRVQRSFLVNLHQAREKRGGELIMNDNSTVPIGRNKIKDVEKALLEQRDLH